MRILIVEDDAALGKFLQKGLTLEGHEVRLAVDGQAAVDAAWSFQPDLMVLDLGLPHKDGVEVLAELNGGIPCMSVLILTGRHALEERLRCLDLGADDCLLKPFSYMELTARCRALLRRRDQFADATLRAGAIELNRILHKVAVGGKPVELTVKEFALLEYLMQARGRTCTRSELLREVWQMSPDAGTNVVDVYVNYLRKKLTHRSAPGLPLASTLPAGDRLIETVRGEGYAIPFATARKSVDSVAVQVVPGLHSKIWSQRSVAHA
jgi:DNA-binding response OmpR family regulator